MNQQTNVASAQADATGARLPRIAAVLAAIIGAMAIFAGGQVIFMGKIMPYHVIDWLPVYNFAVGVFSLLVTAGLLWRRARTAMMAAVGTLATHALITVILLVGYRGIVAGESLKAMTVRLVVWCIIVGLMVWHRRK
jgi:hypothetical protein